MADFTIQHDNRDPYFVDATTRQPKAGPTYLGAAAPLIAETAEKAYNAYQGSEAKGEIKDLKEVGQDPSKNVSDVLSVLRNQGEEGKKAAQDIVAMQAKYKQGISNEDAVHIGTEALIKKYSNKNPMLASSVIAASREILGTDPTGSQLKLNSRLANTSNAEALYDLKQKSEFSGHSLAALQANPALQVEVEGMMVDAKQVEHRYTRLQRTVGMEEFGDKYAARASNDLLTTVTLQGQLGVKKALSQFTEGLRTGGPDYLANNAKQIHAVAKEARDSWQEQKAKLFAGDRETLNGLFTNSQGEVDTVKRDKFAASLRRAASQGELADNPAVAAYEARLEHWVKITSSEESLKEMDNAAKEFATMSKLNLYKIDGVADVEQMVKILGDAATQFPMVLKPIVTNLGNAVKRSMAGQLPDRNDLNDVQSLVDTTNQKRAGSYQNNAVPSISKRAEQFSQASDMSHTDAKIIVAKGEFETFLKSVGEFNVDGSTEVDKSNATAQIKYVLEHANAFTNPQRRVMYNLLAHYPELTGTVYNSMDATQKDFMQIRMAEVKRKEAGSLVELTKRIGGLNGLNDTTKIKPINYVPQGMLAVRNIQKPSGGLLNLNSVVAKGQGRTVNEEATSVALTSLRNSLLNEATLYGMPEEHRDAYAVQALRDEYGININYAASKENVDYLVNEGLGYNGTSLLTDTEVNPGLRTDEMGPAPALHESGVVENRQELNVEGEFANQLSNIVGGL